MERYLPFYQYYHSGATYRDDYYFLRAKGELSPESGSFVLDEEAEFSTGYDILAARLISVDNLKIKNNIVFTGTYGAGQMKEQVKGGSVG